MAKKTKKVEKKPKKATSETSKIPKRSFIKIGRRKHPRPKKPSKSELKSRRKLSNSYRLFRDSLSFVRQYWKVFGGIIAVYLVLSVTLVGGLGGGIDVKQLKTNLGSELGRFSSSLTLFSLLVGSVGTTSSERGAAYQTIVLIVVSLATIWALRQLLSGEKIKVKDSFYKGMFPLVPFVLVLLVISLQLLPLAAAGFIYSSVVVGGLAVSAIEKVLWIIPVFLLFVWSIYMLTASLFALYIVTLPNMQPMAALRAAKELVKYRRWVIMRKLILLVFILVFLAAIIVIPLIIWASFIVVWVFVLLSAFGFILAHTYIYNLYREML